MGHWAWGRAGPAPEQRAGMGPSPKKRTGRGHGAGMLWPGRDFALRLFGNKTGPPCTRVRLPGFSFLLLYQMHT